MQINETSSKAPVHNGPNGFAYWYCWHEDQWVAARFDDYGNRTSIWLEAKSLEGIQTSMGVYNPTEDDCDTEELGLDPISAAEVSMFVLFIMLMFTMAMCFLGGIY